MGIGPSSKETTLHHYRDPLVACLSEDTALDFPGIVLEGTPEVCDHKQFVADRAGAFAEMAGADGVLVSIDSWGNSHVDFTSVIQAIGERDIPVVGLSFVGNQASFVVTNRYMDTIIDYNKTASGIETTVVGENTATELDARKALTILKNKIRKRSCSAASSAFPEEAAEQKRPLMIRRFPVQEVIFGESTDMRGGRLCIANTIANGLAYDTGRVKKITVDIIKPGQYGMFVNNILDFSPVAVKVSGKLGQGITHEIEGMRVMLTGVEEGGFQPANIGSSEGILGEQMYPGRSGTPAKTDYILHVDALLAFGEGRTRAGIMAAHAACDMIVDRLRALLKTQNGDGPEVSSSLHWDIARPGAKRVLLVKLISGLGCLYDTGLFPREPGGYLGCKSIMDLSNNMQVVVTPNEYRDGVVHSLT